MSIRQVEFGRLDAETEEHLLEYFVDTGVVGRIVSGAKQYIVGRKGSGKTALFRRLDEKTLGHPVVRMEFADYSWEAHKQLAEAGVTAESAYVASWRFTFLMTIVSLLVREGREWAQTEGPQDYRGNLRYRVSSLVLAAV